MLLKDHKEEKTIAVLNCIYRKKKSVYKWSHIVQPSVGQGLTVIESCYLIW